MTAKLEVTLKTERAEVLFQEEFWVVTTITNTDSSPVEVHDRGQMSPVRYQLFRPDETVPAYEISHHAYRLFQAGGDDNQSPKTAMEDLPPGESRTHREDLSRWSTDLIEPGPYRILATYQHPQGPIPSPLIDCEITIPQPSDVASQFCAVNGVFGSVLAHVETDGTTSLIQQETFSGAPDDGSFRRRFDRLPHRVDQLAIALNAEYYDEGRWFGWIQNGEFAAAAGFGTTLSGKVDPAALNMTDPRLASRGFQFPDRTAIFFILDAGTSSFVQVTVEDGKMHQIARPAPWQSHPTHISFAHVATDTHSDILVAYCENVGGINTIKTASFSPHSGLPATAPVEVQATPAPIVAFTLAPLVTSAPAQLHWLRGPEDEGLMTYQRATISGTNVTNNDFFFFAPEKAVDEWTLSPTPGGHLPVLILSDDTIFWLDAGAEQSVWTALTKATSASALSLLTDTSGVHWVQWYHPLAGLLHAALPIVG